MYAPTRRHHVLVLASRGPGAALADAFRSQGLAVGSLLLPPSCTPRAARTLLRNTLSSPSDRPVWQATPVIVTAWTNADAHLGATVTATVHATTKFGGGRTGPPPRWLYLSGSLYPHGHHSTLTTPLTITDRGVYVTSAARKALRTALITTPSWTEWSAVLRAVLSAVPASPRREYRL